MGISDIKQRFEKALLSSVETSVGEIDMKSHLKVKIS